MRSFFTTFLVALLLACPAMCRATDVACCPGHEAGECSDEPGGQIPTPVEDADSCICSGTALRADDGQVKKSALAFDAPSPELSATRLIQPPRAFACERLAHHPDDWLGHVRLHVFLEVFRC